MSIQEISPFTWIIAVSLLGGAISVICAAVVALNTRITWIPMLISYAIGALLGAVFLEILPHAFEAADNIEAMAATILLGILLFFVLEIIAHEIPQEVGDFLILLHSGYSKKQALAFNLFSSLATVIGGLLAYFALKTVQDWVPTILGLAAASMIYVAVADLIPGLHKRAQLKETLYQVILIASGIGSIWLVKWLIGE